MLEIHEEECLLAGSINEISFHTFSLAKFVYHRLLQLRHANGRRAVLLYHEGSQFDTPESQGSIVNFNLLRPDGSFIGFVQASVVCIFFNSGFFGSSGSFGYDTSSIITATHHHHLLKAQIYHSVICWCLSFESLHTFNFGSYFLFLLSVTQQTSPALTIDVVNRLLLLFFYWNSFWLFVFCIVFVAKSCHYVVNCTGDSRLIHDKPSCLVYKHTIAYHHVCCNCKL